MSSPTPAPTPRVAILLSGERRTWPSVRQSLLTHLLPNIPNSAIFDCADAPLSLPYSFADRLAAASWRWPSSSHAAVLIQFERNHRCWELARSFESRHRIRFDAVLKIRPDLFIHHKIDVLALLRQWPHDDARSSNILLSRARCWPEGTLPRQSWTWGHTRCGSEALADDALLLVPTRAAADAIFGTFDSDLLAPPFPRCNVSFKAAVVAECVLTTHLRRRRIEFVPTSFDVAIARADGYGGKTVRIEGMAQPPVPRFLACATEDRKGVCRVALPYVNEMLTSYFASSQCRGGGGSGPSRLLRPPPVHVMVGCDNAPAFRFDPALDASPRCRPRFDAHAKAYYTAQQPASQQVQPRPKAFDSSRVFKLAIMVLKEPQLVSERVYGRSGWNSILRVHLRGSGTNDGADEKSPNHLLIIDAFGSLSGQPPSSSSRWLSIPWAALSYPARGRPPSDLRWPSSRDVAATSSTNSRGLCAFMGLRNGNKWGVDERTLRKLAPGYEYRDALVKELACTHLQPGDRNTHVEGPDGLPMQSGPFEGAVKHYKGYRFVVAVENTNEGSPVSEKIINAYLSHSVPIVWGGGAHKLTFNPKSFVDCTGLGVDACATLVRAVDKDAVRYEAMRRAPRLLEDDGVEPSSSVVPFAWSGVAAAKLGDPVCG